MTETPKRPDRGPEMDAFLLQVGWGGASRRFLAGDASFRRYERVHAPSAVAVLMDAPPPWEDVRPFLSVTEQLQRCDVRVPEILAADAAQGFLLLEDLGDQSFTKLLSAHPEREREIYLAATDALVAIHRASGEYQVDFAANLPPYDEAVYLREAGLFAEWFLPQIVGLAKASLLRTEFLALWRELLALAGLKRHCLVHRDFHADNLFWTEGAGHHAVGMIDYQDALWGDAAYDLASLLEDARRDVAAATMVDCFSHYVSQTGELAHGFAERYALLAAQRNAKIIGIFTRLCVRDGKAHYLNYLPRVWAHFQHDLTHPILTPIRQFVDQHVPQAWRGAFQADASIGGMVP